MNERLDCVEKLLRCRATRRSRAQFVECFWKPFKKRVNILFKKKTFVFNAIVASSFQKSLRQLFPLVFHSIHCSYLCFPRVAKQNLRFFRVSQETFIAAFRSFLFLWLFSMRKLFLKDFSFISFPLHEMFSLRMRGCGTFRLELLFSLHVYVK